MNKKRVDFETTVLDCLPPCRGVRRERLIEYLMKSHSDETGYSEPNINRKIGKMKERKLISIEKDPKVLIKFGIEKEADNASYIFAKNSFEIIKHLNHVFEKYKEGDVVTKETALVEIKRYDMISFFSPSHLDILISDLDEEEVSLIDSVLGILYNQIVNKGNEPGDKEAFLENLRNLLKRHQEEHKKYSMLRRRIIWLLGYYNDKAVLEQLKADIEAGRLSETKDDYWDRFTARVIEEGRTELFDIEICLKKEGNTETANILAEIRDKALAKSKMPIEPDLPWEDAISRSVPIERSLPPVIIKSNDVLK